jgi:CRISPR-associated protein Cmr1
MEEVTFHLKTITPLFMAGADQSTAELRAPSFRGEMRYWQRALIGGINGTGKEETKQMASYERGVFGATDIVSFIQIRVHNQSLNIDFLEREGSSRADATGRDYLLWSVLQRRRAVLPQSTFQVTLAARRYEEEKDKILLERAVSSFWLLTHLGGVGARSRRCAGSLSVIETKGETFGFPFHVPTSVEDLQQQLGDGIARSKSLYDGRSSIARQQPFFDTLQTDACHIWILLNDGKLWQNSDQALRDIGSKLQQYRDSIPINERRIFGIPVMVMDGGKPRPYRIKGAGSKYRRVASPLHLHLSELQIGTEKRYVGIATLFKTRWKDMSDEDYQQYDLIDSYVARKFKDAQRITL